MDKVPEGDDLVVERRSKKKGGKRKGATVLRSSNTVQQEAPQPQQQQQPIVKGTPLLQALMGRHATEGEGEEVSERKGTKTKNGGSSLVWWLGYRCCGGQGKRGGG